MKLAGIHYSRIERPSEADDPADQLATVPVISVFIVDFPMHSRTRKLSQTLGKEAGSGRPSAPQSSACCVSSIDACLANFASHVGLEAQQTHLAGIARLNFLSRGRCWLSTTSGRSNSPCLEDSLSSRCVTVPMIPVIVGDAILPEIPLGDSTCCAQ